MTIQLAKNHISVSCANHIQQITNSLTRIGISYFEHIRIYHTGKIAWLSTDDNRAKTILENEIAGTLQFDFSKLKSARHVFAEDLVETIKNTSMKNIAFQKLKDSQEIYDIRNLFQIISIKENLYEAFVFGTNIKNNLTKSDYVSIIPILEQFIFYYYDTAINLITEAENSAIEIPGLVINTNTQAKSKHITFPVKRYYFNLSNRNEYLSKREFEVLQLLYHGASRKEIANQMKISPSTVDSLLSRAVIRTETHHVRNLFDKICKSTLSNALKFAHLQRTDSNS